MSLSHGEAYTSGGGQIADFSTAEGTVHNQQVDQLDKDMQALRLIIQKMDIDERPVVSHTSQNPTLASMDLSNDIQSTLSLSHSVDQDLVYFVNYR